MTLWFVLGIMTAAAIFAVLWPLGRRHVPIASRNEIRVYRDQLDEIERDRAAGNIGDAEAEAARTEVSRLLLAAAEKQEHSSAKSPLWRRRAVALAGLVLLPAMSAALYLSLGSPDLPGQPLAARVGPQGTPPITQLVAQVETHLARNPQDGRGWEVIAPVYMRLERFDDAARAWRNTIIYSGATAQREASLGEALTAAAKGIVTADAKAAFERALALDEKDAKARYFLGLAAEQDGRPGEAVAAWRSLLATAPPDAVWVDFVRAALARAEGAPARSREPSAEEIAAAAKLRPEERQQMILGMVEGLANRLKDNGGDIEGWLRLVRAYTVLGARDKARSAAAAARRAVAHDPDKLRKLDELVKGLDLEG